MQESIVVSASFKASKQVVWNAITNANEMQQWYFASIQSFKAEVGFQTQFLITNEDRNFTHIWTVDEVIPIQKICYNWRYAEYEGDSEVVFEISDNGTETRLTVTHTTLEPFTADIPEFKRESGVQGWNYLIKESLFNYLNQKS